MCFSARLQDFKNWAAWWSCTGCWNEVGRDEGRHAQNACVEFFSTFNPVTEADERDVDEQNSQ